MYCEVGNDLPERWNAFESEYRVIVGGEKRRNRGIMIGMSYSLFRSVKSLNIPEGLPGEMVACAGKTHGGQSVIVMVHYVPPTHTFSEEEEKKMASLKEHIESQLEEEPDGIHWIYAGDPNARAAEFSRGKMNESDKRVKRGEGLLRTIAKWIPPLMPDEQSAATCTSGNDIDVMFTTANTLGYYHVPPDSIPLGSHRPLIATIELKGKDEYEKQSRTDWKTADETKFEREFRGQMSWRNKWVKGLMWITALRESLFSARKVSADRRPVRVTKGLRIPEWAKEPETVLTTADFNGEAKKVLEKKNQYMMRRAAEMNRESAHMLARELPRLTKKSQRSPNLVPYKTKSLKDLADASAEYHCHFESTNPEADKEADEIEDGMRDVWREMFNEGRAKYEKCSEEEVEYATRKQKETCGGIDGVESRMISLVRETKEYRDAVRNIVDEIFEQAIWPSAWKTSAQTYLAKVKEPEELKDTRPISMLPVMTEIAERIIKLRCEEDIPRDEEQYGMEGAPLPLAVLSDQIMKMKSEAENGGKFAAVALLLLDFKQAFDRMPQAIIRRRLLADERLPLHLRVTLSNFLRGRGVVGQISTGGGTVRGRYRWAQSVGACQGSVLGPWLWSYHVGTLLERLNNVKGMKEVIKLIYVDDLTILARDQSWKALRNKIEELAKTVEEWAEEHRQPLNIEKSHVLPFDISRRKCKIAFEIKLKGGIVKKVEETRILGLIFAKDMKFAKQFSKVRTRAQWGLKRLSMLWRQTGGANLNIGRVLVESYVYSHLRFATSAWFQQLTKRQQEDLEDVAYAAARLVTNLPRAAGRYETFDRAKLKQLGELAEIDALRIADAARRSETQAESLIWRENHEVGKEKKKTALQGAVSEMRNWTPGIITKKVHPWKSIATAKDWGGRVKIYCETIETQKELDEIDGEGLWLNGSDGALGKIYGKNYQYGPGSCGWVVNGRKGNARTGAHKCAFQSEAIGGRKMLEETEEEIRRIEKGKRPRAVVWTTDSLSLLQALKSIDFKAEGVHDVAKALAKLSKVTEVIAVHVRGHSDIGINKIAHIEAKKAKSKEWPSERTEKIDACDAKGWIKFRSRIFHERILEEEYKRGGWYGSIQHAIQYKERGIHLKIDTPLRVEAAASAIHAGAFNRFVGMLTLGGRAPTWGKKEIVMGQIIEVLAKSQRFEQARAETFGLEPIDRWSLTRDYRRLVAFLGRCWGYEQSQISGWKGMETDQELFKDVKSPDFGRVQP